MHDAPTRRAHRPDPLTLRWNGVSLRTKITGVTVLLVTLGLVVAGVGTSTVLRNYLLNDVNSKLVTAAAQATAGIEDGSTTCATSGPNTFFIAVLDSEGGLLCANSQSTPAPVVSRIDLDDVAALDGDAFTSWSADRTAQWQLVAVAGSERFTGTPVTILVGLNLADTNRTIATFAGIFFGFGISVIVLGAALTRLLVTSTFAPLRQVEATAAAIAAGNFGERMPGATPNTEVGRLNRSLNTMLARFDQTFADRARTIDQMRRFVGDASHELRTPLVSVRGYAELYRMGALTTPEEVGQAMDRIEKEAIRMGGLVEDLLELARLDDARPPELAPVDLVPLAYDSALDAMAQRKDRTVTVVFLDDEEPVDPALEVVEDAAAEVSSVAPGVTGPIRFAGAQLARLRGRRAARAGRPEEEAPVIAAHELETPAIVLAEENKIRQVITNLMGNAIRFTDDGSPLEIGVGVDAAKGMAMIDIIDHGDGIPPQIRDKIFQRFWRADSSRTRETGGSGLGLAIVSGIVQAHGGTVDVFETEGGGATFRVSLPLAPRSPSVPAAP